MPWSNASAQNYVLLIRNGIQTDVANVQSETAEDVEYYDGETYRDEIDSTFMGTARSLVGDGGGFAPLISNGFQGEISSFSGFDTVNDPHLEQSDSFTHTPPHPLEKTRTRFLWWSGASGTGDVVGWAWADQVVDFSPSTHVRI